MIDVYEKALDNAGRIIAGVKPSQFGDTTPCPEFKVKDLINHIIGGCYMMSMVSAGQEVPADRPRPDLAGDDPVSAFEQGKKLALEAFKGSDAFTKTWKFNFGQLPGAQAIGIGLIEATVHGWDLATATGQKHGIDPNLATTLLEGAKQSVGEQLRNPQGNPFGPLVPTADGADPVTKLVSFFGRKP